MQGTLFLALSLISPALKYTVVQANSFPLHFNYSWVVVCHLSYVSISWKLLELSYEITIFPWVAKNDSDIWGVVCNGQRFPASGRPYKKNHAQFCNFSFFWHFAGGMLSRSVRFRISNVYDYLLLSHSFSRWPLSNHVLCFSF